jgi:hypothetical protein
MSSLNPDRRQRLLETLSTWLDGQAEQAEQNGQNEFGELTEQNELPGLGELAELDEPEPAPAGIAPEVLSEVLSNAEAAPDLFSLLSQLTALTRETQLQGRATNRLHTELGETLGKLTEQQSTPTPPEVIAQKLAEARRETRSEILAELLEVRDRFTRSLDEAQRRLDGLSGLRARFGQRPVLEAVLAGNNLARERLDDLLRRLDVHEVVCLHKPFDPSLMRATEVSQTNTAAPGTVLEIIRPGYTCNGRVLRFAEVKVVAGLPENAIG